jgi:outer membrane protein assembly factor BamA
MRTLLTAVLLLLPCARLLAQVPSSVPQQPVPVPPGTQLPTGPTPPAGPPPPSPTSLARWLNPSTAPFLPVPEIATDPNGGTTVGLLPVWLSTDAQREIDRIIAPDVLHNTYFGYGMHARLYEYPSDDEQWSIVGGVNERVEREIDLEYQIGRARRDVWSFNASVIAGTDGTPRFYGIGNHTPESDQSNYTARQELGRVQAGWNISHIWQLAYTLRARQVDVLPGTLPGIYSIQQLFGNAALGTGREFLNRLSLIYDTRDDLTVPSHGMQWIAYSGVALSDALFNDQLYKEAGLDGRGFWPVFHDTVLAAHVALRYLISDHNAPFWALSTLGGENSDVGGEQPLRGFGAGRFTDRDSYSTSVELRHNVLSFDAVSTRVDVEVTPFVDAGRVFSYADTFPLSHIHTVGGVGFRGIAKPFVVGYVDVGYGSEGAAVFTGINYPF